MNDQDQLAKEAEEVILSITKCVDRGIDPESGKRGKCHYFSNGDICECGEIDLSKFRMS